MPIATYDQYCSMLDRAHQKGFAYPAINITSTSTANAALKAFADLKCDGILQVSTGGGKFASGQSVNNAVIGAISLAQHIHLMASRLNVLIAIHTDHCPLTEVDSFLRPLLGESAKRKKRGELPLFQSHMFDGADLPLEKNLEVSTQLLKECRELDIILEVETGVVGGEEDGVNNEGISKEKLYTTPEEMVTIAKALRPLGRFMYAATFGNVHGVYKPGNVKLKPKILQEGQIAVKNSLKSDLPLDLVFHGGSGSDLSDIHETLRYGVIKMNIDTDTQYAYTRPIVHHMLANYDKVLKVEGEVGSKKHYDPRVWMKEGEKAMTSRIIQAIYDLKGENTSLLLR